MAKIKSWRGFKAQISAIRQRIGIITLFLALSLFWGCSAIPLKPEPAMEFQVFNYDLRDGRSHITIQYPKAQMKDNINMSIVPEEDKDMVAIKIYFKR